MKNRYDILEQIGGPENGSNLETRAAFGSSLAVSVLLAGMFWVLGWVTSRSAFFGQLSYGNTKSVWAEDEDTVMGPVYRRRIEIREAKFHAMINWVERLSILSGQPRGSLSDPLFRAANFATRTTSPNRDSLHVFAPP